MYCATNETNTMKKKIFELHSDNLNPDWLKEEVSTGTTILALEFDEGVICGADSLTTLGSYVENRFADKITKVTDSIYCLRSGSASDTQSINDIVKYQLSFYEQETNEPPLVGVAANLFRNIIYRYKDRLLAQIIVAGWDKRLGGQVYNVSLTGMLNRLPIVFSGSGSTYIAGYIDSNFKHNMNKDEAIQFVLNAITLAIGRDNSSGGSVNLAIITKDGIESKYVLYDHLPDFYKK